MYKENRELYEFGRFRLDVREHRLEVTHGEKIGPIPEKAFQTLIHLVRNRGRLVTKPELLSAVWPDAVVEENNLDKAVHTIRLALGEKPGEQKYIETVRKHGYRFVAAVNALGPPPESEVDFLGGGQAIKPVGEPVISTLTTSSGAFVVSAKWSQEDDEKTARENGDRPEYELVSEEPRIARPDRIPGAKRRSAAGLAILLALSVGLVSIAVYSFTKWTAVEGAKSIAVLPLNPIDRANRIDLYEIGIADSIIHQLGGSNGIVVRPLSATRKYSEIEQDPIAAGRQQKVDYVLASNYQIANGRIKVTAQLLSVATGKAEDTISVEKDATDLFSAQDAIAAGIGSRILARFGAASTGFRSVRGTNSEAAYSLYLQAMNLSEERGVQNVVKALEYLERAVELDPNYAIAWASKAHLHRDAVGHTDTGQHEHYQKSMEAIKRALAIDPNLSDAYSALCHNKNRYEFDFTGAEMACKRALELDPNSPVAHKVYANFLYTRGRFDEAIIKIKTAMELQPVSYQNQQIYALTLYFARRYSEAEEQFKRLIELSPSHSFIHGRLILVLQEQGKEAEAFEYLIRMLAIQKEDEKAERFKTAYRTGGWRGVLIERIKIAEGGENPRYFQLACLHAKIGEKDKALDHLDRAYQERRFEIAILQVEPQLDSLRDHPRYLDLVRRIEGK